MRPLNLPIETVSALRRATIVARWGEGALRASTSFQIRADGSHAKVYVYGLIGGYDLDAAEFVTGVHELKAKTIDLHVNSEGGFVFDAVAMFEALKDHPAKVTTHIDALAASAASFLALAGDEVQIAKAGRMMIHDALGVGIGNAADMRDYADILDDVSDDISGYYADKAGGKPSAWRTAMKTETWYSAQEAVDSGLVDRVARSEEKKNDPENRKSQMIRARARVALGGVN